MCACPSAFAGATMAHYWDELHFEAGPSAENVVAAIDIDRVTGHCGGVVARQKDASRAYLLDGNEASRRSTLRHPFHQRIEIGDAGGGARSQWAGADGMYAN